jgi:uncharacterized protein with von Willebrand factor type A (vWA) domain
MEEIPNRFNCKGELKPSIYFLCELGNEISKARIDVPVSTSEMQDAIIAIAKAEPENNDQLYYTLETFLNKSGTEDSRAMFREAYDNAVIKFKEVYPDIIRKKKDVKEVKEV